MNEITVAAINSSERVFLLLCTPAEARRYRIIRAVQSGMELSRPAIVKRFQVSRATATRDLRRVRPLLERLK
jgi:hypothetical protein